MRTTGINHIVECYDKNGIVIHCSENKTFDTLATPASYPPDNTLIEEAQSELVTLRKAVPPFNEIEFRITHKNF